jgi:hypothetical protein
VRTREARPEGPQYGCRCIDSYIERVFVSLQHVLDRLRQPRSRADELLALRRRARVAGAGATPRERALARELRALRAELAALTGPLASCSTCARGLPGASWDGGHCCGGETAEIFDDAQLAALVLGGTRAADLRPPAGAHAGCAFRGATGCSLPPVDRPVLCVTYFCRDATRELARRGLLDAVEALVDRARARFADLTATAPAPRAAARRDRA